MRLLDTIIVDEVSFRKYIVYDLVAEKKVCLICLLPVRSGLPFRCCFQFELRTFTESLESLPERRTVAHYYSND